MGRLPKSLASKRRIGTDRPDRTPSGAQTVTLKALVGTVSEDGQRRVIEQDAPWIRQLDARETEAYLVLCREGDEMRKQIAADGIVLTEPIVSPSGKVVGERRVPHPLLKELRALEKSRRDLASALGFDPSSRSRLGLAEAQAASALEGMLARFGRRPSD